MSHWWLFFFFQAEDGIRDYKVTGVQTCALPICERLAFQVSHTLEHPGSPCDLDQVNRVDDAGAASRRPPLDRLAVQEMRAHEGRDREERRVGKECRSRWSPYH